MKLATTTGDFRAITDNQFEILHHLHQAGFRYVDYSFSNDYFYKNGAYSDNWYEYSVALRKESDSLGMQFVQAHAPMGAPIADDNQAFVDDTILCIEVCHILGIRNLVVHSGYLKHISKEECFAKNKLFFMELLKVAEKYDIHILIENFNKMWDPDTFWVDNATDLLALITYINHPLCHAIWDTGHGNLQEMPQHEELKLLGRHVRALHIQDNGGKGDDHLMPFQGTLNLDSVMHGLKEIGYQGYFTFEARSSFLSADKRREYTADTRISQISLDLRIQEERLLYEIGKYILTSYDCFEE